MTKTFLLKIWRILPSWLQGMASRIVRPLFQVFTAAVIFNSDHQIYLVKTTYNRFHPWGVPGGSLEYGESADDALLREMLEETSLHLEIERILFTKTFSPDRVGIYYLCKIVDGKFQPSEEVSEFGYFSPDALPDVRLEDVELIKRIYKEVMYELA